MPELTGNNREIEAKFYLSELLSIRDRLNSAGARISSERVLERNWRFDTADRRFEKTGEVLRLRVDHGASLTYKRGTGAPEERIEIDIEVSDGSRAIDLLQALGYELVMIYEKYREVFLFEEGFVFLDELPFGNFVEVEGDSIETIKRMSKNLGLRWEMRVPKNYVEIFLDLSARLSLSFSDATFENFSTIEPITPEDLNLQIALD